MAGQNGALQTLRTIETNRHMWKYPAPIPLPPLPSHIHSNETKNSLKYRHERLSFVSFVTLRILRLTAMSGDNWF